MKRLKLTFKVGDESPEDCSVEVQNALVNNLQIQEVDILHAQKAIIHCNCNLLPPLLRIKKTASGTHLVNDPVRGVHALNCPLMGEIKKPTKILHEASDDELIFWMLNQSFFQYSQRKNKELAYKRWDEFYAELTRMYPFFYGFVGFGRQVKTEKSFNVQLDITKEIDDVRSCEYLANGAPKVGPWLTISIKRNTYWQSYAVPVASYTQPLVIRHEKERKPLLNVIKKYDGFVSPGYYPLTMGGKKIKAFAFGRGDKVTAYISKSEKSAAIKQSMLSWGIQNLKVEVISA